MRFKLYEGIQGSRNLGIQVPRNLGIQEFSKYDLYVQDTLHPLGIYVPAITFGLTLWELQHFLAIDHSARLLLPEEYASVILESHVCYICAIGFPNRPYCINAPLLEQRKEPNPIPPNSKPARLNQPNATVEHLWESKATLSYLTLSAARWHSLPYQEILNEN